MLATGVRRVARNVTSLLTTDVVTRGTTFFMYVAIARYLGTREFGQVALALNLFHVFHIFSVMGLRNFITREVAKDRSATGRYLLNGSIIVFVSSVMALGFAYVFVKVMRYADDTSFIIVLVSVGLVPYALSVVCEAIFRAWEKMQFIAYTYVTANLLKLVLVIALLVAGYGLVPVILVLVGTRVATMLMLWWFVARRVDTSGMRAGMSFSRTMLSKSITFFGLDSVHVVRSSFNTILLSKFGGETAVGLYNAATQIRLPITVVFVNVSTSVFPVMCRRVKDGLANLKPISETLIALLLAIAIPAAAGLFLLSDAALILLYEDAEFHLATPALQIIAWTVIATAMTSALGQVLLSSHNENINLRIVLTNFALSIIFGIWLVSQYGIIGAAASAFLVSTANVIQHYVPVARLLNGHRLWSLAWQPVLATLVMSGFIMLIADYNFFLIVGAATLVYAITLGVIVVGTAGSISAVRERYRYLLAS